MEEAGNRIYLRGLDPQGTDSLSKIAQRIAPGAFVLDLGCGPGTLGSRIAASKGCICDGVESNAEAAALALPHYRRIIVADLESGRLAEQLDGQRYDYVVCADVLEHLRHPERVLTQLPGLLTASGRILLSIPNVSYAGLVGALINGDFRYRDEGLLDESHLRFFTRKSLMRWLAKCDMRVARLDTVTVPISQSEFAHDNLESLPPAVVRTLLTSPDALTYQFIVEVTSAESEPAEEIVVKSTSAAFTFAAQLFFRTNEPFDEAHSSVAHGSMGEDRQCLVFSIPPLAREITGLRLHPSNRPGYLRLFSLALFDAEHECIWTWDRSTPPDGLGSGQIHFLTDDQRNCRLLVLEGDAPWLELPIKRQHLARLHRGGSVELDVAWPQSSDSLIVIKRLLRREGQLERVAELEFERAELRREQTDMRSHIETLSNEIKTLQQELRAERANLERINQSLTFRAARPLFGIVNRLRRPK